MKSEWTKYCLADLYEAHNGLSKGGKFFGSGYPFLSFSTVFNNWFIPDELTDLVQSTEKEQEAFSIRRGDIFVTRTSETMNELGMSSVALKDYPNATYNGFTKRLRPTTDKVLPEFIGYYLRCPFFRNAFKQFSNMTTRASLKNEDLLSMQVRIPLIETQRKIASILKNIDDIIKENTKTNNNLYQVATALLKQALIDNASVLITENLGNIADVKGGKRLPKGTALQTTSNTHPYIRVRDLNNAFVVQLTNDFEYVDDETQKSISRYTVNTSDVLISIVGTIGMTALVHPSLNNANLTENCVKLTNLKQAFPEYLLLYLNSTDGKNAISQGTVGAVQAKLPIKNIQALEIPLLPVEKMTILQSQIHSLFEVITENLTENARLLNLKDTLLPKLISGELDVSEVNI